MRLSHRDVDILQHTILALHDIHDRETFWQAVPNLFLKAIPGDWFVIMDADVDMAAKRVITCRLFETSPRLNDALVRRMERVAFDHPFSSYIRETGDITALKFSDFYSLTELRRTEMYNEFYRHAHISRFLATACENARGLTTLNVARPPRSRDFTERDRVLLNLLRPHFEQTRSALMHDNAQWHAPLETYGLSPREREVAHGLVEGKSNEQISRTLHLRTRTVEKHVERILEKLGVENRTAAALLIALAGPGE